MSMHSVTNYELHEEVTHISETIAAGFPPLEMFTHTDLSRPLSAIQGN